MMTVSQIAEKMIDYYEGSNHDIDHFIRVWSFAGIIGRSEGLDAEDLTILEIAAITHDIACPLCRRKYGSANGKRQEAESPALVIEFLSDAGLNAEQEERVIWLVSHHHTFHDIGEPEHQILLEADYIVNAMEKGYSRRNAENFLHKIAKTACGKRLLASIFCLMSDIDSPDFPSREGASE